MSENNPIKWVRTAPSQFFKAVMHFSLRPWLPLFCAWSNRSDREAGKKLPAAVWLPCQHTLVFGLSCLIGYAAIREPQQHRVGNLIAVGHPSLPPLARGSYPEQGCGGVKASFICNLSSGHAQVKNVSSMWCITLNEQGDRTAQFTTDWAITVRTC